MQATWTDQEIAVAAQKRDDWSDEPSGPPITVTVEALVWGSFAIHDPLDLRIGGVTVTHVPTGWSVVPSAISERSARRFCEEVAPLLDWDTLAPAQVKALPDGIKASVRAAMRRAQGVES